MNPFSEIMVFQRVALILTVRIAVQPRTRYGLRYGQQECLVSPLLLKELRVSHRVQIGLPEALKIAERKE